jgi:S1-C subfamily serine protease
MRLFWILVVAFAFLNSAVAAPEPTPKEEPVSAEQKSSVVRVNSTNQGFDFLRPWNKQAPTSRRGLGVLIDGGKILVTAELVTNSNYVELEKPDGGARVPARVDVIDYEANLATLVPVDLKFLDGVQPLGMTTDVKIGDKLSVLQLEASGTPVSTQALVTSVEIGRFALEDSGYLMFRMSCPLQFRDNSYTVPIVKDNKLVALLMRYDSRSQTIDGISSPVIEHFLKEASNSPYKGFPRAGLNFSSARDPQLRRYLKLQDSDGGVYVSQVDRSGPAANAGVQEGDILVSIDEKQIDPDGNYMHPTYGKLSITHLTTTDAYVGQKVMMTVIRNGQRIAIPVELYRRSPDDYVVAPYSVGKSPRYFILDGLVFQELTRQYLREWGANWQKDAPQRLVYYDRFQSDLFPEKRKIVFLSQILPTSDTVGYEQLNHLVVKTVNNKEIKTLDDLVAALKAPLDGFDRFEFEEDPHEIYLNSRHAAESAAQLQKIYSLPALQRL